MAWDRTTPTNAKYRSPEHRAERRRLAAEMQARGYLWCAQPVCVMPTRVIQPDDSWHVGHDDSGSQFIGAVHVPCNIKDAAVRARARQLGTDQPQGWTI